MGAFFSFSDVIRKYNRSPSLEGLEIYIWRNQYEQRKQSCETRLPADWGKRKHLQSCQDSSMNLELERSLRASYRNVGKGIQEWQL